MLSLLGSLFSRAARQRTRAGRIRRAVAFGYHAAARQFFNDAEQLAAEGTRPGDERAFRRHLDGLHCLKRATAVHRQLESPN